MGLDALSWRLDVQGMRGVTMLVIVLYHAGLPLPGGFIALDVFFVVSGFVITGMLMREYQRSGTVSLRNFYLRRFKRLTPALVFTLILVTILSVFIISPLGAQQVTAYMALGATFLSANLVAQRTTGGYFDVAADYNPLLHTWSLSVEEQFYLLYPVLLVFGWYAIRKLGAPRHFTTALVIAVGGVSFALTMWPTTFGSLVHIDASIFSYYSPVVRVWEFVSGALLVLWLRYAPALGRWSSLTLGWFGVALLLIPIWAINSTVRYPGPWTLFPVLGSCALLYAGTNQKNIVTRAFASRSLVYTGDRSYSWYLWHWPIIVFAVTLWPDFPAIGIFGAVVSIVPALICFNLIESRYRVRKMTLKAIGYMSLALITASAVVALAMLFGVNHGWWNPKFTLAQAQVMPDHTAQITGCHSYDGPFALDDMACWWGQTAAGAPIYLVGDSNAEQFSEAVIGAGAALARPVHISTRSACPYLGSTATHQAVLSLIPDPRCAEYSTLMLNWFKTQSPGLVVLAATDSYWTRTPTDPFPARAPTDTASVRNPVYAAALTSIIKELQAVGHQVLVVQTIPHFNWDPRGCSAISLMAETCHEVQPLSAIERNQGSTWATTEAVTAHNNAALLDLRPELCSAGTCSTGTGDRWRYRDGVHISVPESIELRGTFATAIRAAEPRL
jgi:peptidoglycan/LPS O-acetylase OafA/YrhL